MCVDSRTPASRPNSGRLAHGELRDPSIGSRLLASPPTRRADAESINRALDDKHGVFAFRGVGRSSADQVLSETEAGATRADQGFRSDERSV